MLRCNCPNPRLRSLVFPGLSPDPEDMAQRQADGYDGFLKRRSESTTIYRLKEMIYR